MNSDQGNTNIPPETLCDACANQPDCNEHHQMCVNFEAKASNGEEVDS